MTVFCGSLSVRQDSRRGRFELAKAEAYGGPAGCYRVRINRVWHDVDGKTAFLTPKQAVGMAVMMTLGVFEPEPLPDIPRVSALATRPHRPTAICRNAAKRAGR